MMKKIANLAKGAFLISLLTVHTIYFGNTALERFLENGVSVKKIVHETKALLPPAVSEIEKSRPAETDPYKGRNAPEL